MVLCNDIACCHYVQQRLRIRYCAIKKPSFLQALPVPTGGSPNPNIFLTGAIVLLFLREVTCLQPPPHANSLQKPVFYFPLCRFGSNVYPDLLLLAQR